MTKFNSHPNVVKYLSSYVDKDGNRHQCVASYNFDTKIISSIRDMLPDVKLRT